MNNYTTELQEKINLLKEQISDMQAISSAQAVATWDIETHMPAKGAEHRAWIVSVLSKQNHERLISPKFGDLLNELKEQSEKLNAIDKALIRVFKREYDQAEKIPTKLVQELSELTSKSHLVWASAKQNNNFKEFSPLLEKVFNIKKQTADCIGYDKTPYDALLDSYEPKMTAAKLDLVFSKLKDFLIPFVEEIKNSPVKINRDFTKINYDTDTQFKVSKDILEYIGYDFSRGRLDKSHHPFTIGLGPDDVRVTTRIKENNFISNIGSSIHEGGHGIYELGVDSALSKIGLGSGASLGIHESQSRFYETIIGQGLPFWKGYYSKLQTFFPKQLENVSLQNFYSALNYVEPSFIRVDSDEVTYNIHIIIRYELERDILEGRLKVSDLPSVWNEKMKKYLGIVPSSDSEGCLQDVHWSWGAIGYFPTYTIGNLFAAQVFNTLNKQIPDIESQIESGNLSILKNWLGKNIHFCGMLEEPNEIILRVTGEDLNSDHFISYIKNKYQNIYGLK